MEHHFRLPSNSMPLRRQKTVPVYSNISTKPIHNIKLNVSKLPHDFFAKENRNTQNIQHQQQKINICDQELNQFQTTSFFGYSPSTAPVPSSSKITKKTRKYKSQERISQVGEVVLKHNLKNNSTNPLNFECTFSEKIYPEKMSNKIKLKFAQQYDTCQKKKRMEKDDFLDSENPNELGFQQKLRKYQAMNNYLDKKITNLNILHHSKQRRRQEKVFAFPIILSSRLGC